MTGEDEVLWAAYADAEHPDPQPVDEPVQNAVDPRTLEPRVIVVVGSSDWSEPLIVQAALLTWAARHGDRPITLVCAGAPTGAELEARELAFQNGWMIHSSVRDDALPQFQADVVFAFARDGSGAHEVAMDIARVRPVRLFRDDVLKPPSVWDGR